MKPLLQTYSHGESRWDLPCFLQARSKFEPQHQQLAAETWAWREKLQRSACAVLLPHVQVEIQNSREGSS